MLAYILRRIVLMVPTLLGVTVLLFLLVRFSPGLTSGGAFGGAEGGMRGSQARLEAEKELKKQLGMMDENGKEISPPMQYLHWLGRIVRLDLGESVQYHEKVSQLIAERLPVTLWLNLISVVLVYVVAMPGGMLAAVRRGKTFDVWWSFLTLALFSLPIIWIGDLLLGFLANSRYLGWFPAAGTHATDTQWMSWFQYAMDYAWHMVLPVVTLSYAQLAYVSKLERAAMLDNLGLDYVRTARAKGLAAGPVITRHVFRNSLLPMITLFGMLVPTLLGGTFVVERIFSIKGMGDLMVTAVNGHDLPIVQAVTLIVSVISVLALLVTDICYVIADPRVSYE